MDSTVTKSTLTFSAAMHDKLQRLGTLMSFHENDVILNENTYIRAIPIVVKGTIKVTRSDEEGREVLLYYIGPGESCIMSFLGGIHHETSKVKAIADSDVDILLIPLDKVILLTKDDPEWVDYIFNLYHKRFEELLAVVNSVVFKKLDDRILQALHEKARTAGSRDITITHKELADELGTSRVVVSRLLKQLENNKVVILGRNKISLCNISST